MIFRCLGYLILPLLLISCASSPMIQPQINSLTVAQQFDQAIQLMENNIASYGENNSLLYYLDYAMVLHLAERYEESVDVFEKAKSIYDQLYTRSLSKQAGTWLINDNTEPYRGEDFERVMLNIFQSLNFIALGNFEEALVEARDADNTLAMINSKYAVDQKNVYKEDAFARFLMGILYEANGTYEDKNNAFIAYAKAVDIYEKDYVSNYDFQMPQVLKENILAAAQWMGPDVFETYRRKFAAVPFQSWKERQGKGEIYFIQYHGLSPIKHQGTLPIPLPDGHIVKFVFPKYDVRQSLNDFGVFKIEQKSNKGERKHWQVHTQLGEDINAIAKNNLKNRAKRIMAKTALRAGGKYLAERSIEKSIERKHGKNNSQWVKYIANLYNIGSEQADLRSWQTLPAEIRIARLILEEDEYVLSLNGKYLKEIKLKAGEKLFFIVQTR